MTGSYEDRRAAFNACLPSLGFPDSAHYQWYHTVELPQGLVTPGMCDYRDVVAGLGVPGALKGKAVLDVGPATGFFSFEMERRGARVIAVDAPSLKEYDRFPGQTVFDTFDNLTASYLPNVTSDAGVKLAALERLSESFREPFEVCRTLLRSNVERRFMSLYDVSPATIPEPVDIVLAFNVLLHTIAPMDVLRALASVAREELYVMQDMPGEIDAPPVMHYVGGEDPARDMILWWQPNAQCFAQYLRKLGFPLVEVITRFDSIQSDYRVQQTVIRARR